MERLARIEAVLFEALRLREPGPHGPTLTSERGAQIVAPARRLMERGGKRWRALFMQLACEMHGGGDRALPLVPLVELTHAGSLIIDDIEDGARTRRGGPAAHVEFGVDVAVNAGNLVYFLPTRMLDRPSANVPALDAAEELRVYRMYAATMRKLHYGQGLDILWHRPGAILPSAADYMSMCTLKSGSLAGLALGLGAALGGAEAAAVSSLVAIGERFGVSFQIIDDVTNLERGNPGKDRGDDLIEGKKSLPLILHRERGGADELWGILDGIQNRPIERVLPQIDRAVALLQASGSLQDARRRAGDLYRETRVDLAALVPEGEPADRLLEMADALIGAGGPTV
ncbi:MAG: polyprenyl synthetase family protein [Spirochaetaceae bacterium]|nr:polyprenyl synthetase family protein [Spirochaetaceae bacterium]